MTESLSIAEFIRVIEKLPSDGPIVRPGIWYTTQKEHWLGWLAEYDEPGAYRRISGQRRDARYAYNHIVEPKMLTWLVEAVGMEPDLVEAVKRASTEGDTMMACSGAIRRLAPWERVFATMHDNGMVSRGTTDNSARVASWFGRHRRR